MDDRDAWFKKFKTLAEYVAENEPTTLAYEAAVAEDDPLEVLAYERYAWCGCDSRCLELVAGVRSFQCISLYTSTYLSSVTADEAVIQLFVLAGM